jgi:hypothetical protein
MKQNNPSPTWRTHELLSSAYERLVKAHQTMTIDEKAAIFKLTLKDLESYQTMGEEIAIPAKFLHDLAEIMQLFDVANNGIRCGADVNVAKVIQQAHEKISRVESQYSDVDRRLLHRLREASFLLNLLQFAIFIDHPQANLHELPQIIHDEIESFKRFGF